MPVIAWNIAIARCGKLPLPPFLRTPLGVDWVVCGGESGSHARPMASVWAEGLMRQCREAGVAFFMKQLSEAGGSSFKDCDSFPKHLKVREFPR